MPWLVRINPESPCQEGQHHPHRLGCEDPECGCGLVVQVCCVCDHDWPCPTKKSHRKGR